MLTDYLARTIGTGLFAHEKSKWETTGSRQTNNNRKVVRNLKENNVATKMKNPKQGITTTLGSYLFSFNVLDPRRVVADNVFVTKQ